MLLHRSIGLDRFNAMPRTRAIHALYECCNHFTLATKLADARPFQTHDDVLERIEGEFAALTTDDHEHALPAPTINARVQEMLGPVGGWPEYMP